MVIKRKMAEYNLLVKNKESFMSDVLEYAQMSEIPVSSCEISIENTSRNKKDTKRKVINKVNKNLNGEENLKPTLLAKIKKIFTFKGRKNKQKTLNTKQENTIKKGFDIVSAQIVTIFVLLISILLTNVFWEDSAINVFFKNMFNREKEVVLNYNDFNPTLANNEFEVALTDGVITFNGEGTVYAPTGGEVESVSLLEDGSYQMVIAHSDTFKTVLEGINYPYYEKGNMVYSTCPIGYTTSVLTAKMYNNDTLLTNYSLQNGNVIWE